MAEQGEYFLQRLGEIEQQYESVVDARGLGLMVAIEFKSEEQRDAIIDTALQTGSLLSAVEKEYSIAASA